MTFARSYLPTDRLNGIKQADPLLGEQIEKLCRAALALRGAAIAYEANGMLRYSAMALEPFVLMVEPFDAAMAAKASSVQAKAARARRNNPVEV